LRTLGAVDTPRTIQPLRKRRLALLTAALMAAHLVTTTALILGGSVFQNTLASWSGAVLSQPARSILQVSGMEARPLVQWLLFLANSLLWGFCLAFVVERWLSKRAALVALVLVLSSVVTLVGMGVVFTGAEWLGLAMAPIWASTIFAGAYFFPDVMGEVGTPAAHGLGIILNAVFLTMLLFIALRLVKRLRRSHNQEVS